MDSFRQREMRKDEHVKLAMSQHQNVQSDFEYMRFVHHSISHINLEDVDLLVNRSFMKGKKPLYINAMTGGSRWTKSINDKLSQVAHTLDIPMAVGSTHAALKDESLKDTFEIVRHNHPKGLVMSNVGADVSLDGAKRAVEMLEADALQIHVNTLQELVMPEGSRDFVEWMTHIESIQSEIDVPVIIKEVGFGMSHETLSRIQSLGIKHVDVSGRGGTNFALIENERRPLKDMAYMSDWGQSTLISLLETKAFQDDITVFASGGIRNPLDAIKALTLGATAVGMSRPILEYVEQYGVDETINYLETFYHHMKKIAVLLDKGDLEALKDAQYVMDPYVMNWITQRGI
ncbi:type 2 isopentenyl-diphosphate Delta-isomerase [Staphylococcus massiliensis]|uniref:Isopentenyl-diphosphate delta-isomerase n=1 Tax=Staphylococcus massiliensis S46 TaxID=1229783 RepID=K9B5I8_9STAP|nr:type 2 isopentenyl-diphosphate Delta-isomerase [Staphylococcus massiliensis]EKU49035.1 isopentenyl pyrophosphate isomerase [Staphylococcus massiliensis S46]MCG3399477.1 type 2 isopentenyl-diphosphate Delta-isomerase [Staphylococcus massiliensis]MCG3402423.1 type 2 isopentenyl-diphosphate Delta-isomerase [Staphylococcus massiliensis]MCG3411613.1 type 2 isopentenyl-diphosphate Delta-isomerase [Staphylococcus massiliensis]PNZ99509.1 type 2 isopentenyl-diphosphate Delta-isomerase [Staphylococcu